MNKITTILALTTLATAAAFANPQPVRIQDDMKPMAATMANTTGAFKGIEVNGGMATFAHQGNKRTLSLSPDFKIPNTPAPHWQVVDSRGNTYLLSQLKIAGGKFNRTVTIPSYVRDIAKVQIWCSFAEVNLGEASFAKPVK